MSSPGLARKRQLDEASDHGSGPAKRARLAQSVPKESKALQQPTPRASRRPAPFPSGLAGSPLQHTQQPESVDTFVSRWLDSLDSDREARRCRSGSYLRWEDISRLRSWSAPPEMSYTRDADGFVVPPTPDSTKPCPDQVTAAGSTAAPSDLASSCRTSSKSLVEDPLYRDANLAENNIFMRPLGGEALPGHVAHLVDHVGRDRSSPGPSAEDLAGDEALADLWMNAGETEVEDYFRDKFSPALGSTLKRSDRQPMSKHTVPTSGSKLKISNPVPDMLYGYNRGKAFTRHQQTHFNATGNTVVANGQNLTLPFFAVEFKGDGGSMWVATNQCLGASASCVNVAERLNQQLRRCRSDKVQRIDSSAFSIATNGTEARLYVSWKQSELEYCTASVRNFMLQEPGHYRDFRRYVRNIIDWGKDKRLTEIRDALDTLLEESGKRPAADEAGAGAGAGKRRKSSSSSRGRGRSVSSARGEGGDAELPYWETDAASGRWFHRNEDGTITWTNELEGAHS